MSETKHVNNSLISSPAYNETEIFCTYITYVGSYLFYKYYSIRALNSSNVFPKLRKDIFKIKMNQRTYRKLKLIKKDLNMRSEER